MGLLVDVYFNMAVLLYTHLYNQFQALTHEGDSNFTLLPFQLTTASITENLKSEHYRFVRTSAMDTVKSSQASLDGPTYTLLSCNSAKSQSLKKTLKFGDKN